VVMDNKPLSFFPSQTNHPYRQTRWRMLIQSYDFDIIDRAGKDNFLADALSRIYEEREAGTDMILVDLTERKAITGPYSARTSTVKPSLHLAQTLDPVKEPWFFSPSPFDPSSIPYNISLNNVEAVPIPDSHEEKVKDHHPGPFEQGLSKMETTLEEGIDAMYNKKATTQRPTHDPTEITILIQAPKTQLAELVSRIHSPSNQMERSLRLNLFPNWLVRIHDAITNVESIALTSSGYETTPSITPSNPP